MTKTEKEKLIDEIIEKFKRLEEIRLKKTTEKRKIHTSEQT